MGGSVGTSMSQTLQERREQFHLLRLDDALTGTTDAVSFLETAEAMHFQENGDSAESHLLAVQHLANLRQQQAASLAYFDVFWVAARLALLLVPTVLLMSCSVAEKGEPVGGE